MLVALIVTASVSAQQPQQPVFRSDLDVVRVDVSVRTSGTPVGGLNAKDFVLLDNGVRQTIDSVEMEEVPIDVSVLIDANEDVTMGLGDVHDDVRKIAALLRPSDRLRVTAINGGVSDLIRARPAAGFPALSPVKELRGLSNAADGIGAALMRSPASERRHLIIAITNGVDAVSSLAAASLPELARRSQAVLHVVQLDVELVIPLTDPPSYRTGRNRLESAKRGLSGLKPPTRLFWRPYDNTQDINALQAAAESTGGKVHLPGLFLGGAARIFEKVFQDYRRSYLLRYSPAGVKREGWHEITVTVPAYPGYEVTARRGYSIETPAPSAARSEDTVWLGPSLESLVELYNRNSYGQMEAAFARATPIESRIAEFRKRGNPWPANPAREAAFAIELAETALRTRRTVPRDAALALLKDFRRLVRHSIEPDPFERYWLWTATAMLQGANVPAAAIETAEYALTRFPDEPRLLLARAFATDQTRAFEDREGRGSAGEASFVRDVIARYDAAARFPDTAAEARIRKAFFLHRIGRDGEALAALDAAGTLDTAKEPLLAYLSALFRGRVLEALERFGEAARAYDAALAVVPRAQSARVAKMRLAVRAGNRPEADTLASEIQSAESDFDPWWVYWLGDFRHYASIVGRLREMTQ